MPDLCGRAIKAFRNRLPVFYQQCRPLVDPLISLLAERIYLDIGNTDLPLWRDQENKQQAGLRSKIVGHLMNELRQVYNDEVQFDDDHEDDIFTIVLYWYLKENSAKFLRERKMARHNIWSTAFFWGFERRSPRPIAYTTERALEYCSPLSPVFIRRESSFAPNSFYGERDPHTGLLSHLNDSSDDENRPANLDDDTKSGSVMEEDRIEAERRLQNGLSKRYLSYVEKPSKYGQPNNSPDDEGQSINLNDDTSAREDEGEIEERLQEELSKRYLGRAQKRMKYSQRARANVNLPAESTLPEKPSLLKEPRRNLAKIPTKQVLTHVLERTDGEFHEKDAFTPETRSLFAVLESGSIGLNELRELGGHPEEDDCPGVYLHIVWTRQGKFWLYVGQSMSMRERILKHCDQQHRKRHPSLHYSVWDSDDVIGDIWVTLSRFPDFKPLGDSISRCNLEDRALLLNIEEMFMSCVLQTLRRHHLERYLPGGTPIPWAGSHLNIALPLWQGFSNQPGEAVTRQTFTDAIHSSDKAVRKWAASWRNSYNALRYSSDPLLRGYWAQQIADMRSMGNSGQSAAMEGVQRAKKERYRELLNSGGTAKVHQDKRSEHMFFAWGEDAFHFPLLKDVRESFPCKPNDQLYIRPLLFQTPQKFPFARAALATDPASRLIIAVRLERGGEYYWGWPYTEGKMAVLSMNHFVDCLEGLSLSQSRQLPRRSTVILQNGRRTIIISDPETLPEDAVSESLLREIELDNLLP